MLRAVREQWRSTTRWSAFFVCAMTITIKLFAWLRDRAGREACRLTLPAGARAADARASLAAQYPALEPWLGCVRPAVNAAYQDWEVALQDGDELALIPPVSGG